MPQQVPIQTTTTMSSNDAQQKPTSDINHQSNIVAPTLREDGDFLRNEMHTQTTTSLTEALNCLPSTNSDGNKSQYEQQTISNATQSVMPSNDTALNKQSDAATNTASVIDGSNNKNNTNGSIHDDKQQLQPPPTTAATTITPAPAKLNGLKNRIIQRPPPLVLDKVSNFYDNDTNSCIVQPQKQQAYNTAPVPAFSGCTIKTLSHPKQDHPRHQVADAAKNHHLNTNLVTQFNASQTDETFISDRTSSNNNNNNNIQANNANQKFWASLNENASRNKALANARSVSATNNETKQAESAKSNIAIANDNDTGGGSLGPDLIIKQRNSSGNISSSRVVSTLSARKQHEHQNRHHPANQHQYHGQSSLQQSTNKIHSLSAHQQNDNQLEDNHKDRLNVSDDLEDYAVASEINGGNLIGVENTTPPAFDIRHNSNRLEEPPASATGSRPRSNNPFLDENDDDFEEYRNSVRSGSANRDSFSSQTQNNFHKRPASFIAATDRLTGFTKVSSDFATKQQIIEEKLNELHINDQQQRNADTNSNEINDNQSFSQQMVSNSQQLDHPASHAIYQRLPQLNNNQTPSSDLTTYQSVYGHNERYIKSSNEPTISVDSESTIRQPPPSATMQLPHWTDTVYELNNAILETCSIAGGAENGQFIHIVESGDIILELDQIKVSGFTLVEFNELVDSKQFHLLKAVQTKHSHGLMLDLREYLNLSFPKNSKDKQLQNIIRDNIYRRTIPCTTRPPKEGEVDKVDYHFLTKEQFIDLNKRGMLLECGVYVGHYYGTLKPSCDLSLVTESSQTTQHDDNSNCLRQAWDSNHPAVEMILRKDASHPQASNVTTEHPLYENQEALQMQQLSNNNSINNNSDQDSNYPANNMNVQVGVRSPNIVAVDSEAMPPGWERVVDQAHGTYYIDHNTQRTQYERPYEVELTKGSMGFGFTLVEADSGLLLVRSIIPGGPAHMNGTIRPGDILISAVGVSVTGLQHTDIARLFSTFAVGDRVRLTFARSNYILDDNLVPDEYLFSNGTNGDLAIAVNPNNYQLNDPNLPPEQNPHIVVNQEFEFIKVVLKRGDQGFGFTISDSIAGQKVRKIQNHNICSNLKQGDILINLNGEDITKLAHKKVVELLKNCPPGEDVSLIIKRKKRFRSKTPLAMHTDATDEYSLDGTPQRNCKTPSLDGLMLKRPAANYNSDDLSSNFSRTLFQQTPSQRPQQSVQQQQHPHVDMSSYGASSLMSGLPLPQVENTFEQQLYGSLPITRPQPIYGEHKPAIISLSHQMNNPQYFNNQYNHQQALSNSNAPNIESNHHKDLNGAPVADMRPDSIRSSDIIYRDDVSNSVHASEASQQQQSRYHANLQNNDFIQVNQYNNYMNNDKLMMMQMQQPRYHPQIYSSDYHQVPLYSNSEVMKNELLQQQQQPKGLGPILPIKPTMNQYLHHVIPAPVDNYQDNFYANNEEIALQNMQYGYLPPASHIPVASTDQFTFMRPISHGTPHEELDDYEYHNVDLERENTDSNWGIRLIGGAEVDRAISIGSMIFGGAASKSGKLKSGDEIISIDGVSVVGATHQHVVDLISACANRVSLVVRRKAFAEACEVVLTKNMDEGFGFVIISNENCAVIGKIIENSPADRCKQLRVRDCIIAVNGRYITPDMKHPEIVNMIKECGSTLRLRIIPVDCYTVKLIKDVQNDSFGFRMRGGSEYDGTPLYIVRVEPNGQAHGLLNVGDQILEINNIPTVGMTHQQAATIIKYSDPIVKLKLRRNYVTPPSLLVDSPRSLQKYNQTAEMKQVTLASTPNMQLVSAHEASFASLPSNVNLLSHPSQHQQQQQQQMMSMAVPMLNQSMQQMPLPPPPSQLHHQPMYDHHSMTYVDQGTLYAS